MIPRNEETLNHDTGLLIGWFFDYDLRGAFHNGTAHLLKLDTQQ